MGDNKHKYTVTLSLDEYNELRNFKESVINSGEFPVLIETFNPVFNVEAVSKIKYCTKYEAITRLINKVKSMQNDILELKEKDNKSKKAMRELDKAFANRSNRWVGKFFKKWLKEQL